MTLWVDVKGAFIYLNTRRLMCNTSLYFEFMIVGTILGINSTVDMNDKIQNAESYLCLLACRKYGSF